MNLMIQMFYLGTFPPNNLRGVFFIQHWAGLCIRLGMHVTEQCDAASDYEFKVL